MISFTLDTNCLVDLEESRPAASAVAELVDGHRRRTADVAVTTVTASERQRDGGFLQSYDEFQARLLELGLDHLTQIQPLAHWDVSFFGHGYWPSPAMAAVEAAIHDILHPDTPISYPEYCEKSGIDPDARPRDAKWRNRLCDTQFAWSHIHHARQVLVTGDANFFKVSKLPRLVSLGVGTISKPDEAVELLRGRHSNTGLDLTR